jgi:hypothetical protein
MNFQKFQAWREDCLRAEPGLLDCGETNLYRALASMQPQPALEAACRSIHRCDLARLWLSRYGFSEKLSRQALVSRGVRHALELVFREIARTEAALWIPRDVYPVYQDLARATGNQPHFYSTLPQPKLPSGPAGPVAEFLLVTNPWKPLGRFLDNHECNALLRWLEVSLDRRLLMDCVYDLVAPFHETTCNLLKTGRVILLHSVTKGWLRPKTFGVTLLTTPWPQLESAFREEPVVQNELWLAERLFTRDAQLPGQIATALAQGKRALLASLPDSVASTLLLDPSMTVPGCYLFPAGIAADVLLNQHRILAVPASAVGAEWSGSILTSLARRFIPSGGTS